MITQVNCPVLIMHGTKDSVVPLWHAQKLHQLCPNALTPLWVEGGDHDDLYTFEDYMKRLKRFVDCDLQMYDNPYGD